MKSSKKKKPEQFFVLDDRMYRTNIAIAAGIPQKKALQLWNKWLIKNKYEHCITEPDEEGGGRYFCMPDRTNYLIWFLHKAPSGAVVAHEALHIIHHSLDARGLILINATEEAYCYYLTWLVREIGLKLW